MLRNFSSSSATGLVVQTVTVSDNTSYRIEFSEVWQGQGAYSPKVLQDKIIRILILERQHAASGVLHNHNLVSPE
jgi:hypothetical protein